MGYSNEIYNQALEEIAARRRDALDAAADRKADAYRQLPELTEIDTLIRKAGVEATRLALNLNGTDGIRRLQDTYNQLSERRALLLASIGMKVADFDPQFNCPMCSDTGYTDGKLCSCARRLARSIAFSRLCSEMPLDECTFDSFSLGYYNGNDRERMTRIYERAAAYAAGFGDETANLLFMGRTGLGKTHLSLAIAGAVTERGYGVVYGSAHNLLRAVEREHFGGVQSAVLDGLLDCDLLILDDLGAEFSTSFTQATIYNIINTRMLSDRPTIISTNLSPDELNERYGERVMSRIIGNFEKYLFVGNDIRQQKALAKK